MAGILDTLKGLGSNAMWGAGKGFQGLSYLAQPAGAIAGGFYGGGVPGAGIGMQVGSQFGDILSGMGNYLAGEGRWAPQQMQQPAMAGQMMPQQMQQYGRQQMSPERMAEQQLLRNLTQFDPQPFIRDYQQNVMPQLMGQYYGRGGGRSSAVTNALEGANEGLASHLRLQQMQQNSMLGQYLSGQQDLGFRQHQARLGQMGQMGGYGLDMSRAGLQRRESPIQPLQQLGNVGMGGQSMPYQTSGTTGFVPAAVNTTVDLAKAALAGRK